ncbi:MAG: hypothetical protein B7Z33_08115 [Sphingomonadales bacterium 12-68-11]|nr:MAG: hypothetical protein B7Z33_08115 [Sphingomonadales bacterium 12-68-11]
MTGVHRVAQELANALAQLAGDQFEVWLPHDGTGRAATLHLPNKVIGPLRGIPWEQLTLPVVAGDRIVLNLCNIGPMLSRRAVTMIHDAQVHTAPASYSVGFRLWYKLVQPILARRHRRILTVSEYSRGQLIAAGLGSRDTISVVHNGADHVLAVAAQPEILPRLALPPRSYVVALAATQAHKNIRVLLEAFADPRLADLQLVLIGGADPAEFGRAVGSPPANVVFAGRVSDGELRALYEHALCLAFPSTTEGFGLPPLEAMRVGCPAVVAPCGALPEVCGDAALYAEPHSPPAWQAAILELAGDPAAWKRRSEAGRAHAAQFTWRRAAEQVLSVLALERGQTVTAAARPAA